MNFLSFRIRENEIVLGSRIIISLICYTSWAVQCGYG